jgi:hypothetical protein
LDLGGEDARLGGFEALAAGGRADMRFAGGFDARLGPELRGGPFSTAARGAAILVSATRATTERGGSSVDRVRGNAGALGTTVGGRCDGGPSDRGPRDPRVLDGGPLGRTAFILFFEGWRL